MNRRGFIARVSAAAGSFLAPQSILPATEAAGVVTLKARKIVIDKVASAISSLDFNLFFVREVPNDILYNPPENGITLSQKISSSRTNAVTSSERSIEDIEKSFKAFEGDWSDVKAKIMANLNSPYSIVDASVKELFQNANSLEEAKSAYLKLYGNVVVESCAKIDEIETNLIDIKQIQITEEGILPKNASVKKPLALQKTTGSFLDEARVWLPVRYEIDIPRLWAESREGYLHRTKQVAENFTNYFGQNAVEKIIVPYAGKLLIKPNYEEISDFFTDDMGHDVKGFSSKVDEPLAYPELLLIDFLERNISNKSLAR